MKTKSTPSPARPKSPPASSGLPIKNILVPVDFSEPSNHALVYAMRFAQLNDAKITLLHVIERPVYYPDSGLYYPGAETFEQITESAGQAVARICKEQKLSKPQLRKVVVEIGEPYRTIVAIAKSEKVDLIILSTHGYTGVARVLLGSTAERVVRHASCPVLVVRPETQSEKA